jgi:hypothetical protein
MRQKIPLILSWISRATSIVSGGWPGKADHIAEGVSMQHSISGPSEKTVFHLLKGGGKALPTLI